MSKTSKRRPQLVSDEVMKRNWELAMRKKKEVCPVCGGMLNEDNQCESLLQQQVERT